MIDLSKIHGWIEQECQRLEDLVGQVRKAGNELAHAEATFKVEIAKARLGWRAKTISDRPKPTVDEIADRALIECEELHLPYLLAENNLTTLREALRASTSRLDGLRTLAASFREAGG